MAVDGRDLNPDVLKRWFERKVRFSSAELPMGFMDKTGPFQPIIEPVVQKLLGTVVDMKVRANCTQCTCSMQCLFLLLNTGTDYNRHQLCEQL